MTLPIEYKYAVYDFDGYYIGALDGQVNDFSIPQDINTASCMLTLDLQLPTNRSAEAIEPLLDESGAVITDESNEPIYIDRQPEYYEYLLQVNNRIVITEYSDYNVNGVTVFDGRISIVKVNAGSDRITANLLSNAADFDQIVIEDSGSTTVDKGNVSPLSMISDAFTLYSNTFGGRINSILENGSSTVIATYSFIFMTMTEVMAAGLSLLESDYYWYVNCGTNQLVVERAATTATHTFINERHLTGLDLEIDMERIKNVVYFTGGDIGGGVNLFRKYVNPQSVARYGRRAIKLQDIRVTINATADTISNTYLDKFGDVDYRTTITVAADTYDISSINIGETVGFAGFNNVFDSLILQVVRKTRGPNGVTLTLGLLPYRTSSAFNDLQRQLVASQTVDNPAAPS